MRIGVPKEIKVQEYRVGAQPAGVREFVRAGHEVLVETGAGGGSGWLPPPLLHLTSREGSMPR